MGSRKISTTFTNNNDNNLTIVVAGAIIKTLFKLFNNLGRGDSWNQPIRAEAAGVAGTYTKAGINPVVAEL